MAATPRNWGRDQGERRRRCKSIAPLVPGSQATNGSDERRGDRPRSGLPIVGTAASGPGVPKDWDEFAAVCFVAASRRCYCIALSPTPCIRQRLVPTRLSTGFVRGSKTRGEGSTLSARSVVPDVGELVELDLVEKFGHFETLNENNRKVVLARIETVAKPYEFVIFS